MILPYLSSVWGAALPAVANHLWQSTLFAAVVGLLAWLLRKDHARVRYWLWLTASLKFLVPFALLVGLGRAFAVSGFHNGRQAAAYVAIEQFSQPFGHPVAMAVPAAAPSVAPSGFGQLLPVLIVAIWFGGSLIVLFTWCLRWRRMCKVLQCATPLVKGRELEALCRLELLAGIRKHIPLFLSSALFEPGIFGVFRPVLILPEWICERLSEKHLQAVLAHEVWHVRPRDNLAAAVHMLVQALFWFHPLVWWLGSRLVEERERACDEQVLELGNPPHIYAESIVKTCEFCVESPLACMSGVAGGDLKRRIVRIMSEHTDHKLAVRKKLLLYVVAFLVVTVPVGLGLARGQAGKVNNPQAEASSRAGGTHASNTRFEVASIKPDRSGTGMRRLMMMPGRFTATNIPVSMLIKFAYNLQSNDQLMGGPDWINSDKYDIEGKEFDSFVKSMKGYPWDEAGEQIRLIVQSMLADRFSLKVSRTTQELPVYALVVAKHGPKLTETKLPVPPPMGGKPAANQKFQGIRFKGFGHLEGSATTTGFLAEVLTHQLGRLVVDDTGLKGRYDFALKWTPDQEERALFMKAAGGDPSMGKAPSAEASGPSIYTALQEQLGLKLKAEKTAVEVLVIDHIDRPSAN
jgi:uncharacterized protein (TIGR03435 family)